MPATPLSASSSETRPTNALFAARGLRVATAALLAALALLILLALWPSAWSGRQMLLHSISMAVAAPLSVGILRAWLVNMRATRPSQLWLATALQLATFLFWHAPSGMDYAMHAPHGELLLQLSLYSAAGVFWWCITGLGAARSWHAIAALLVTGKLFCLVAVILTFAPRPLYHMMGTADQQLAGLIMITLCPLTYIASALWLCRRWLGHVDMPGRAPS